MLVLMENEQVLCQIPKPEDVFANFMKKIKNATIGWGVERRYDRLQVW